jgi:hypothetical protein
VRNPSSDLSAAYRSRFEVGGVSVQIDGDRSTDIVFGPSLSYFRSEVSESDIHITVQWIPELLPSDRRPVFDSGSVWKLFESDGGFQFDFTCSTFGDGPYKRFLIDRGFRSATLQMSQRSFEFFPGVPEPFDYPLDELLIMHRLTREKAIELHGCGIVRADGIGNLFIGHSGAGKSTTTRLWTEREDVEILSDDRIIVRRDGGSAETPRQGIDAARQHGVLRLRDRSAVPTGHFAQDDKISGMRMYGTPWHGEAMYASPNSAPLARIFILEHGYGNRLTLLSPSQAVAELFSRSFVPFHRHEYVDSALQFLEEVAGAVPVYRFAFEPDQRAVDAVLNLHE